MYRISQFKLFSHKLTNKPKSWPLLLAVRCKFYKGSPRTECVAVSLLLLLQSLLTQRDRVYGGGRGLWFCKQPLTSCTETFRGLCWESLTWPFWIVAVWQGREPWLLHALCCWIYLRSPLLEVELGLFQLPPSASLSWLERLSLILLLHFTRPE